MFRTRLMMMRAALAALLVFGLASAASALAQGAIESFNRAMEQVPTNAPPRERLEAAARVVRASMAASDIVGKIIGDNRRLFTDEQLSRLARAILYKLAGNLLASAGGQPVRLEIDGRNSGGGDGVAVTVIPQASNLQPMGAVIIVGRDQQGSDRIFDVIIDRQSVVQNEREELSATIQATGNDAEQVVRITEDTVNSLLTGL